MPRGYTTAMIQRVMDGDSNDLGTHLGQLCIKANLTPKGIAEILGVQRATLRYWYLGGKVRKDRWKVERLASIITNDLEGGFLPAVTRDDAKVYLVDLKAFVDTLLPPSS